jgi:hypothetical protein
LLNLTCGTAWALAALTIDKPEDSKTPSYAYAFGMSFLHLGYTAWQLTSSSAVEKRLQEINHNIESGDNEYNYGSIIDSLANSARRNRLTRAATMAVISGIFLVVQPFKVDVKEPWGGSETKSSGFNYFAGALYACGTCITLINKSPAEKMEMGDTHYTKHKTCLDLIISEGQKKMSYIQLVILL